MDFHSLEDRKQPDWLANITDDMIQAGQYETDKWVDIYQSGLCQTYNDQNTTASPRNGDNDVQVNYSWPTMMQDTAIQSQRRPLIMVEPHDEDQIDSILAEQWQGILQHQYINALKMPELNNKASIDAFLFGMYIAKLHWDPKAEWDMKNRKWIGKPRANLLFPMYFGADPEAESIDYTTSYVYSGRRVAADWVIDRWGKDPEMRQKILDAAAEDPHNSDFSRVMLDAREDAFTPFAGAASQTDIDNGFQTDRGEFRRPSRGRLVDRIVNARGFNGADDTRNFTGQPKHVTLYEIHFRDLTEAQKTDVETVSSEELEDIGAIEQASDGKWIVIDTEPFKKNAPKLEVGDVYLNAHAPTRTGKEMEPSFPRGRFVLKLGKELILNPKEDDQIWHYVKWPYITGVNHELPHMWRGLNGTEMVENLQTMINGTFTSMLNWVENFGNPTTLQDPSNLLDEQKGATRDPGGIVNTKPGMLNETIKTKDSTPMPSALPAVASMLTGEAQAQGGKHDQATGRGSSGQQTATEIATKQEADIVRSSLQISHRDAWNKAIMELVVEMDQANLESGQISQMAGKDFVSRNAEITEELLELEFAIVLQIGTGLPFDKEKSKQDMERLAAMFGATPLAPEILEAFEVENRDEVLERIDMWPQFQAFIEAENQRLEEEQAAEGQEQAGVGPV